MTSRSVAHYLSDFSRTDTEPEIPPTPFPQPEPEPAPFAMPEEDDEVVFAPGPVLEPEPEATPEDRFEAGRLAGREEIQAKLEAERERLGGEKLEAIAQVEAELGSVLADRLADELRSAVDASVHELSATLARLVVPLARRRIQRHTIDGFCDRVAALAAEVGSAGIEVRGPAALLASLKRSQRIAPNDFRLVEADQAELSAHADTRLFETRLSPLLKELEEIIG